MMRAIVLRIGVILLLLVPGCSPQFGQFADFKYSTLAPMYDQVADTPPLPVIFLPGMKGSRLIKCVDEWPCTEGRHVEVWGNSGHVAIFSGFDDLTIKSMYRKIAASFGTPGDTIPNAEDYKSDKVREGGILESYRIGSSFFPIWKVNIYEELKTFLLDQGGYRDNENLFLLSYDWRLDNRITAVKLAMMISEFRDNYMKHLRSEFVRAKAVTPCRQGHIDFDRYWNCVKEKHNRLFNDRGELKFILVAHSMGGLVAKYFINALEGNKDIHKLVLFASPLFGSVDALSGLKNGEFPDTMLGKLLDLYFIGQGPTRGILFSMPSIFQMLPTYPAAFTGKSLAELGLDPYHPLDSSVLDASKENPIYKTYLEYQIIPGYTRLKSFIKRTVAEAGYDVFAPRLLLAFLKSARCFHRAARLNSSGGKVVEDLENCDERERAKEAENFLRGLYVEFANRPSIAERLRGVSKPDQKMDRRVRTVSFSGHCRSTLVRAEFSAPNAHEKNLTFHKTPEPLRAGVTDEANKDVVEEYGDGTVSIFGTGAHLPAGLVSDSHFVMCDDHVGIVSNPIFQYNLLRELKIN